MITTIRGVDDLCVDFDTDDISVVSQGVSEINIFTKSMVRIQLRYVSPDRLQHTHKVCNSISVHDRTISVVVDDTALRDVLRRIDHCRSLHLFSAWCVGKH